MGSIYRSRWTDLFFFFHIPWIANPAPLSPLLQHTYTMPSGSALKEFLQLNGESALGDVRIEVYHPVEIGDLTIQCWRKKEPRESQFRSREITFGASIYKNGRVIKKYDPQLRHSPWARKAYEGSMCRRDLETMLDDLSCF